MIALAAILFCLTARDSEARRRFEEGDWVAWPDLRTFVSFEVGRNTVYVATRNGILRFDRVNERWLDPWVSVPGPLDDSILLLDPIKVFEDKLTMDIWVQLRDGWVFKNAGLDYWERMDPPTGSVLARLILGPPTPITPESNLIAPYLYRVKADDNALSYRNQEWRYAGGVATPWGKEIYAWQGFGTGILDKYSPVLQLYPQGVGPCPGLAVTDSTIWAAGTLDYNSGWLWKRSRSGDEQRWEYFHPAESWGLETGSVQSLQVDIDGTVWIATDQGLMFGDGKRFRHLRKIDGLPSERVVDVQPVMGGAWIATRFGLAFVDKKTARVIHPDKEREADAFSGIWSQLAAFNDTLYASGPGYLVKHYGTVWEEIEVPTTVGSGSEPLALWTEQGWLAIGTRQGIAWRSPDGEWRQAFNNLWDEGYVFAIDFQGGYFWLGTDRGLARYDPREGDAIRYSTREGLPGNVVFEVIGDGDYLWLGTDVALVRFRWNAPGRLD